VKRLAAFLLAAACAGAAPAQTVDGPRRSGFADMGPALQAIQKDDLANPAMLAVAQGEALWSERAGAAAKSCADCHGDAASMRGVATRYPAVDPRTGAVATLDARIAGCRTEYQQVQPRPPESPARLALLAFVSRQSRGLPISPAAGPGMDEAAAAGERLWRTRFGQLDLACAECHDARAGAKLAGVTIPQAHPTGYPLYRSEWQAVGSLERRIRNCMTGIRAEPFAYASREHTALEAWLMRRASGMEWETPAVRP
jgi:sulfur-oxidizing protein SoxA